MKLLRNDGGIDISFTMRMDSPLYDKLKETALKNKRSIRRELEYITEQYLKEAENEN